MDYAAQRPLFLQWTPSHHADVPRLPGGWL